MIHADWFTYAVDAHYQRERCLGERSSAWSAPHRDDGKADLAWLSKMREKVQNLLRVHGVPKQCSISFAAITDLGAGLAGFEDAPNSFDKPFIRLDKSIYESCEADEVLDVYCGVGLHEGSHIKHTRDFFRRQARGMTATRRTWENIWEDERIEELARKESPGFAPYLQVTKRVILEKGEIGQALATWDALPDLDKVSTLMFAFVRCPYLITVPMQKWTTVDGEYLFVTLRTLSPAAPQQEDEVEALAIRFEECWLRLQGLYAKRTKEGATDPAASQRLKQQQVANEEDRATQVHAFAEGQSLKDSVNRLVDKALRLEQMGAKRMAERLIDDAAWLEERGQEPSVRSGRRFGFLDLERFLHRQVTVHRPLDADESKALAELNRERRTEGDCWEWGRERQTVVAFPFPTDSARQTYEAAKRDIRPHLAAMRAAFEIRHGQRTYFESDRKEGRLHVRKLAHAVVTERIYRRKRVQDIPGLALCLLLDESGSMLVGNPSRASAALRVAVLMVEALRNVPGIELEVYSHTSCAESPRDCLLRYLFGKRNRTCHSIGAYGDGRQNYDHQAMLTAAKLFRENTRNDNRLLIVLSDGFPNGFLYSGERAIRATRDAATHIQQQGIKILNVAIEDYRSEDIYGERHVVKYTDPGALVANMKTLITRIVRQASER